LKLFVRSGTAELCVEDSQTPGSPLVCLHAGVTDRRLWSPQVEAFQSTHRMIAYDRRGFGETRMPPLAARDAFSQVGDLLAVLDALAIDRAVLMGCSQGGRIAIDMALAHPERVQALVLVACSVSGAPNDADGPFAPVVQARIAAHEAAEKRGDQAALNELDAQFWLDGPEQPTGRVGGALRELFLAMNAVPLASGSPGEALAPPPAWARLAQIGVPTLVVSGTLDFGHLGRRMRELARRIPGATTCVMDGVAHLPGLERPAEFNRALRSFLDALPREGTRP
jgi:pimeloyl-ACP methyl ester carboxylesterase